MKSDKCKANDVLGKMIENIDPESLDRTRRKMCTPEDYTNFLMEQFDMGKMTLQEMISRAMMYGKEHSEQNLD